MTTFLAFLVAVAWNGVWADATRPKHPRFYGENVRFVWLREHLHGGRV